MFRFLLWMCFFLPSVAAGQTIPVRSGEHETFSRLVLEVPEGIQWQLGRSESGYALQLDTQNLTYDLSQVFSRIPRDRLADIQPGERRGSLQLTLNCDCYADAFLFTSDNLVIDIRDGPIPEQAAFETTIDKNPFEPEPVIQSPEEVQIASTDFYTGPRLPSVAQQAVQDKRSATISPLAAPVMQPSPEGAARANLPSVLTESLESLNNTRLSDAETALIENLGRAASQGLLTPDFTNNQQAEPSLSEAPEVMDVEGSQIMEPNSAVASDSMVPQDQISEAPTGIQIQTSIDQARPNSNQNAVISVDGGSCLDDSYFDFASWGDATRDFGEQVGERRLALSEEFDRIQPGSAENLARLYLYFGFGLEARNTLSIDGVWNRNRALLAELSRLIDGVPENTGLFANQIGCPGRSALWAALTIDEIPRGANTTRAGIVFAFGGLPATLRGHLGPILAEKFLESGDDKSAEAIISAIQGAVATAETAKEIVEADLSTQTGNIDSAIDQLTELSETDLRMNPESLARLLDLQREQGQEATQDLLDLVETARYEFRGSEVIPILARAELQALASLGQHANTYNLLDHPDSGLSLDETSEMADNFALQFAETLSDANFLEFAFGIENRKLAPEAENAIAQRLMILGFAEAADGRMRAPSTGPIRSERRYLQAELALLQGLPQKVSRILTGNESPKAMELKASALTMLGQHGAALALVQSAQSFSTPFATGTGDSEIDAPEQDTIAWRAGAWSSLSNSETDLMRRASLAMQQPKPIDLETLEQSELPPLSLRRGLLENSQRSRELADDLLSGFLIDPDVEIPGG